MRSSKINLNFFQRAGVSMKTKNIATMLAIFAVALYAINVPVSKLLMEHIGATMMAGFLYLAAGIGMLIYVGITKVAGKATGNRVLF